VSVITIENVSPTSILKTLSSDC